MGILRRIFGYAQHDVPYDQRDIVSVNGQSPHISFRSVLETGQIPVDPFNRNGTNQHIDWSSDDAFTRAISTVRDNTIMIIRRDPHLQELLSQEPWSRDQRAQWEWCVSSIVSEQLALQPGLGDYRSQGYGEHRVDIRPTRLNDLSTEIENAVVFNDEQRTATMEFDCESMSVVEGCVLQSAEDFFLPRQAAAGDFRVASNYYYSVGRAQFNPADDLGGHAFIVSAATGNIIEATARGHSPYHESNDRNFSFADYVRGREACHTDNSVYGNWDMDNEVAQQARENNQQEWREEVSFSRIWGEMHLAPVELALSPLTAPLEEAAQIYDQEDRRFRAGALPPALQSEEPSMGNYRHLGAVRWRVSQYMSDDNMNGPVERAADGRITNFDTLDMTDPRNINEYERAINLEIARQQRIMEENDSIAPRWMRWGDGIDRYNSAHSELQILQAARTELASYRTEAATFRKESEERARAIEQAEAVAKEEAAAKIAAATDRREAPAAAVAAVQNHPGEAQAANDPVQQDAAPPELNDLWDNIVEAGKIYTGIDLRALFNQFANAIGLETSPAVERAAPQSPARDSSRDHFYTLAP